MEIALAYMFISGVVIHALGFYHAGWLLIIGSAVIGAVACWYDGIREARKRSREKWGKILREQQEGIGRED
jgi:hypothetical protein